MADDWGALAEAVQARRTQLGLRQRDLEARGGPSTGTVRNIEQAFRDKYAPRTFGQIETALGWRPGTVRGLLAGTSSPHDVHLIHPSSDMIRQEADRLRRANAGLSSNGTARDAALDAIARAEREVRQLRGDPLVNRAVVIGVEAMLRKAWETLADDEIGLSDSNL